MTGENSPIPPADPDQLRLEAVRRINAAGQPRPLDLSTVDRHRLLHLWIRKSLIIRGLLRNFEDLCNLALDEPQPFNDHALLLIRYDDSRLALVTGVNTAELAAMTTDVEMDGES